MTYEEWLLSSLIPYEDTVFSEAVTFSRMTLMSSLVLGKDEEDI
jgi:hypothetical protein